jgi:protein-S-isoprenylcysteine O-methyltransferase Ste14
MMRHVTRAVVFSVTVLVSYLLTGVLEDRILSETEQFRPGTATALGMACVVALFVPLFAYTERLTEAMVRAGLRSTRSQIGRIFGALLFVVVVFLILFALFLDRWFNKSLTDLF